MTCGSHGRRLASFSDVYCTRECVRQSSATMSVRVPRAYLATRWWGGLSKSDRTRRRPSHSHRESVLVGTSWRPALLIGTHEENCALLAGLGDGERADRLWCASLHTSTIPERLQSRSSLHKSRPHHHAYTAIDIAGGPRRLRTTTWLGRRAKSCSALHDLGGAGQLYGRPCGRVD
jgi:hypothetical protein